MTDLVALAQILDDAARTATAISQLSKSGYDLTLAEAYAVQQLSIERRKARGERVIGVKMGFTSRAKMVQMGLAEMVWGRLTDQMKVEDGGEIDLARFVHPRVEPEIAFLLKAPLSGRVTPTEAMEAVAAIAPAVEIIDSRYQNFKFNLPDVVADNTSSSAFVVGGWHGAGTDIDNLGMVMSFEGRPVQIGSSAAILGHPARALAAASRLAHEAGFVLEAGWTVLAGGATAAEALRPGQAVQLSVQGLGQVNFSTRAG